MQASRMNFSKTSTNLKPSMTLQNTATLTLTEFKQMRDRMRISDLTEEQERKQFEVPFQYM